MPFAFDKIGIGCDHGYIGDLVKDGVGINWKNNEHRDFTLVTRQTVIAEWSKKRDIRNSKDKYETNEACSNLIDADWFHDRMNTTCIGEKHCMFFLEDIKANMEAFNEKLFTDCTDKTSTLFIQHTCIEKMDRLYHKWEYCSIIACVTFLAGVILLLQVYYERSVTGINKVKQDLDYVTASDFTVEIDIKKADYKYFMKNLYHPRNQPKSEGLFMKEYMRKKIEDILNRSWNITKLKKE